MKNKLLNLVLVLITIVSLVFNFGCNKDNRSITLNNLPSEFDVHTDLQASYLNDDLDNINQYAEGLEELSYPNALNITWSVNELNPDNYEIYVSEQEDFSNYWKFETYDTEYNLYNLKTGTTYYVVIKCKINDEIFKSNVQSFKTKEGASRFLRIPGVTNCRDLGGYVNLDGKKIRQGLIYRTGRLNYNSHEINPLISTEGVKIMVEDLGIKTEIDLRSLDNNEVGGLTDTSVLGDSINYYQCPMVYNSSILTSYSQKIKEVFDYMGNEENYPLFFHCTIGTDRTGVIAFLLNCILNLSEEDIFRDYLLSNFGSIGGPRVKDSINSSYVYYIRNYTSGNTLQEKGYNYLKDVIGVEEQTITSIRNLMIEK